MAADGYVRQTDGYLTVQVPRGGITEIAEVYRELAVRCIEKDIARVLVTGENDDPEGERALRRAFTTMLLAGLPAGFRITLVAELPRTEARFRKTRLDLRLVGIDMQLFGNEEDAARWLTAPATPAARAAD